MATQSAEVRTERLTSRQEACIALVAEGRSSKEIARELGISPSTVDNHIAAAINIVGSSNRTALANWYTQTRESENPRLDGKQAINNHRPSRMVITLPAMGGIRNSLSLMERVFTVLQVMTVSTMAASSLILIVLCLFFLSNSFR